MSGPIQTLPKGLLDLLQLKAFGKNPSQLLDAVQPTLDIRDQYMVTAYRTEAAFAATITTGAVAAIGSPLFKVSGVNFGPPLNRLWYVVDASVVANTAAAADAFRGALVTFDGLAVGNGPHQRSPDYADTASARVNRGILFRADRPFWLQGGALFAVNVLDIASVGITFNLSITFVELIP